MALTGEDELLRVNYAPSISATLEGLDAFLAARTWDEAAELLPVDFPTAGKKRKRTLAISPFEEERLDRVTEIPSNSQRTFCSSSQRAGSEWLWTWANMYAAICTSRLSSRPADRVSARRAKGLSSALVERLLDRVTREGLDIDRFLVITYTKAAAAELRGRIVPPAAVR